jgi:hypothetical protein
MWWSHHEHPKDFSKLAFVYVTGHEAFHLRPQRVVVQEFVSVPIQKYSGRHKGGSLVGGPETMIPRNAATKNRGQRNNVFLTAVKPLLLRARQRRAKLYGLRHEVLFGPSQAVIQHVQHLAGNNHIGPMPTPGKKPDPRVIACPDPVAINAVLTLAQDPARLANLVVHGQPAIRRRRQGRKPLGRDHR